MTSQDDENKSGGKWIVRLRKGLASKFWEDLVHLFWDLCFISLYLLNIIQVLCLIGNQFDARDSVNGIVVSVRYHEDIISIWNKDANDYEAKIRIK